MAWMPGAIRQTNIRGAGGGSYSGGPAKFVWHKTQGGSASGAFSVYARGLTAPHFTVDSRNIYQHIDTNRSAYALANRSGGVQTNRDWAIQIEVVGFSGQTNLAAIKQALRVAAWVQTVHGVPARWPSGRPATSSRGPHNKSAHNWDNKGGHYGHSQVPENDHWDPAFTNTEWNLVKGGGVGTGAPRTTPTAPKPRQPNWVLKKGDRNLKVAGLQIMLAKLGYGVYVNGKFDGVTENSVKDLQRKFKMTQSGTVGAWTFAAFDKFQRYITAVEPKAMSWTVNDRGQRIVWLQKVLERSFGQKITHIWGGDKPGHYGKATQKAVRNAERFLKRWADGNVSPDDKEAIKGWDKFIQAKKK